MESDVTSVLEQKALELFKECDVGNKGYLTIADFAQLNSELQLSDEAINQVFESLAEKNEDGADIITATCFVAGFGTFFRCAGRRLTSMASNEQLADHRDESPRNLSDSHENYSELPSVASPSTPGYDNVFSPARHSRVADDCDGESGVSSNGFVGNHISPASVHYEIDSNEWDPAFTEMINQLSANGIEPQEDGLAELWQRLESEDPHLLPTFEKFLRKVTGELTQTKSYCQSLAMLLRQKVAEHDETITSLHDELENHVRQETERLVAEVRAHEANERRLLERELEEREHHQTELRAHLSVLESRERDLSRLVQTSKVETQRLLAEKESLEMALADRSSAETDSVALNDRMRAVQQDLLVHQNKYTTEVGRLQAERDALQQELEEVVRRNSLLRNERHTLTSPLLLNSPNYYRRKVSAPPIPLLMMTGPISPSCKHNSAQFQYPSPTSPIAGSQNRHHHFFNGRRFTTLSRQSSSNETCGDQSSCDGTCHVNTRSQQVCNSNQSFEELSPLPRATSSETVSAVLEIATRPIPESRVVNVTNNGPLYKVVFLGDSGVGKTALLHRLCYDQFRPAFNATIGMDLHMFSVSVSDDQAVSLQLWDTAGQERYRSMTRQYFRNAHAFVLVYDILCEASFLSCRWWLEEIDTVTSRNGLQTILLLGNKVDRANESRVVSLEQAKSLSMERGMMFAEVSAQTGYGIREVISQLAIHIARDGQLNAGLLKMRHASSASGRDDASSSCSRNHADLITLAKKPAKKEKGNNCLPSCGN